MVNLKSLMVTEDDGISISVYFKTITNKYGVKVQKVIDEEEAKDLISKKDTSVQTLNTKWVIPSWKLNNAIVRQSTYYDPSTGENKIDFSKFKENIIKNCLKEWDVVDDSGNPVSITLDSIGMLPTNVANDMFDKFNNYIYSSEEDKKK